MARDGVGILEDDEEADIAAFMLEACGIESWDFYGDERIFTTENFEKNLHVLEKMAQLRRPEAIISINESGRAPYFVIGYFALLTGVRISEELRQDILEAAKWEHEEGYWLDEDFLIARKAYLKDFREKIHIHKAGQILHAASFKYSGKNFRGSEVVVGINQFQDYCDYRKLDKIRHINLDGWNLKSIPERIFHIPKLKSLSLEHNQITEISQEISSLKCLEQLYLDYNYITELPEAIGELESLRSLDIMHNFLSSLPNSIAKLKNLTHIYVRGTQITKTFKFLRNSKYDDLNQTIYL